MSGKKQSSLSRLMVYAENYRILAYLSQIIAGLSSLLALVPFYFIWKIIREVLSVNGDFSKAENIVRYGWLAVIFSVSTILIYIVGLACSHLCAFHVQAVLRKKLMRHIAELPLGYIESQGSGKIRNIVNEGVAATETFLAHSLPDKAASKMTPAGVVVLLLFFDWKLGLICLIPAVLGFAALSTMMGKKLQQDMKEFQNALGVMSSEAVEYVRGIPVVKTFGQTVYSFKRFKASIDNYEKWTVSFTKKLMGPMVGFTTAVNSTFAFLIGAAYFFGHGGVSQELILNLMFYIILTPILTVTLMKLTYAGEAEMKVIDSMERMSGIFGESKLSQNQNPELPVTNDIEIKDICFSYKTSRKEKKAVDGISLNIKQGEKVAFVGPSGGGKTTLSSLIARFWDVDSGSIKIGGIDVKDISSSDLMKRISYVFQDSKLLKTSILENVRLGKPDATREEVLHALEMAQCSDIIAKLPAGIDTVIGSKGTYVSGGEAQRLSIARAFLKNAPVLILDEATAFADPDNEEKIQKAFSNLSENKTVIMIAHRLSTVTECSRIFVLKDGKIIEEGNHKSLLEKNGTYAHMWDEYNKAVNWQVVE